MDAASVFGGREDPVILDGLRGEESIAELCRREGLAPNLHYRWSKEPADGPRAMAQAGPWIPVLFHALLEQSIDEILPAELKSSISDFRALVATYEPKDAQYLHLHRGHLADVRPEERRFVTGGRIGKFSMTGTVGEILDKVRETRDGGFDQLTVQLVPGHESAIEDWARLFEKI